jgi:hypothetical protein
MRVFIIELANEPGKLADLGEALGERGINITGISGSTWGGSGSVSIITNDESGTRSVLDGRGMSYRDLDVVAAGLEDRPGTLGEAARRLANRGINIEAVVPTGMQGGRVTVALAVADAAAATEALGDLAAAGTASM